MIAAVAAERSVFDRESYSRSQSYTQRLDFFRGVATAANEKQSRRHFRGASSIEDAKAKVTSTGNGFAVNISADNAATIAEIKKRAETLMQ
jgi:hypothetical protein